MAKVTKMWKSKTYIRSIMEVVKSWTNYAHAKIKLQRSVYYE